MALKELQEKRLELGTKIREMAARQSEWKPEDEAAWGELNKEYDANAAEMKAEQERLAKNESVQARLRQIEEETRASSGDRRIGVDAGERRRLNPEEQARTIDEQRSLVLQGWLLRANGRETRPEHAEAARALGVNLSGELEISLNTRFGPAAWTTGGGQPQQRAMSTTAASGGYTIPEGFSAELERQMLAFGSPRPVARIVRTSSGNDVPWPKVTDVSNSGELLGEGSSMGSSVDPTYSNITLKAYKYSSKPILVSSELLEDSAFNLAADISAMLGERLGRITGTHFTTGDNTNKPQGIVTGAAAGKTTASATAITFPELVELVHSVDPAYRSGATGFMMHDNVLMYLRTLLDGDSIPIWRPSVEASLPDRIYGYPVTINQYMASSVASTNVTALFGDFSKYVIRDVATLRFYRLEELYRATDQTGFVAFSRHDGRVLNNAGIKKLTQQT